MNSLNVLNSSNLSKFVDPSTSSNYILMQKKDGEILAVKRRSLATLIGRIFSYFTGNSYQLHTIADSLRPPLQLNPNPSPDQLKILRKINERIQNYNLNHFDRHIKQLKYCIQHDSNPSPVNANPGLEPNTLPARPPFPLNNPWENNWEIKEKEAKEKYKEVPKGDIEFDVYFDPDSNTIRANPRQAQKRIMQVFPRNVLGQTHSVEHDFNLPNIFYVYAIAIKENRPFFKCFPIIGGDRHAGVSSLLEGRMDLSTATSSIIVYPKNFDSLDLNPQETELFMRATKFLLHLANADGKHSEACPDCTLSRESFKQLGPLIQKTTQFIALNNIENDNGFSVFADQIERLAGQIFRGRSVKSANNRVDL